MNIYISNIKKCININPLQSIYSIKTNISKNINTNTDNISLFYNGKPLLNNYTFLHYIQQKQQKQQKPQISFLPIIEVRTPLNGGNQLLIPGNYNTLSNIIAILFAISTHLSYFNFTTNILKINKLSTNTNININSILTNNNIQTYSTKPEEGFMSNFGINRDDNSILGKISYIIYIIFCFAITFGFVFGILNMNCNDSKKQITLLTSLSFAFMFLPLITSKIIVYYPNIFTWLNNIFNIIKQKLSRQKSQNTSPEWGFIKYAKKYSLFISSIILLIATLILYLINLKIITPFIFIGFIILGLFSYAIKTTPINNIINYITLPIAKILDETFFTQYMTKISPNDPNKNKFALYRTIYNSIIIIALTFIVSLTLKMLFIPQFQYGCNK